MKAILFDFGGTIDTDGIHWSEQLWEIYNNYNVPVKKDQFEKAFVNGEKKLKAVMNKNDSLRETFNKKVKCQLEYLVENKYINNFSEALAKSIVNSCVEISLLYINKNKILFDDLKRSFKLGVVSNYYGNLNTVLEETGIKDFMNIIVDSTIENVYKPDPQLYEIAIQRIGIDHTDTYIVGDSYKNDIDPGKKLGAKTVWLDVKSWTRPADTSCADYKINTLSELKEIVFA